MSQRQAAILVPCHLALGDLAAAAAPAFAHSTAASTVSIRVNQALLDTPADMALSTTLNGTSKGGLFRSPAVPPGQYPVTSNNTGGSIDGKNALGKRHSGQTVRFLS